MKADSQRLWSIIRKIFAFQNIWSTLEKILHLLCSVYALFNTLLQNTLVQTGMQLGAFLYALEKKIATKKEKKLHHLWILPCALNLIFLSVMTVCLPFLQPYVVWNNAFCIGISHLTLEFLSHLEFLKILIVIKICWGRTFWYIDFIMTWRDITS